MQRLSAWSDTRDVGGAGPGPRSRWLHSAAIFVLSCVFLAGANTFATGVKFTLVVVVSAGVLDLVRREARDPGDPTPIVCSAAALLVVAVIFPPRFSGDLWSYAIAGRILAIHHASPYLHEARAFPHDPFLRLVGRGWRTGTTPYGPLFTLYAGGVALVGGSHPLLYRLAFQGAAAVPIGFALFALWRATRSTSALVLLGLHPVITCSLVNGGHNDAFIGLGVLLAVIGAREGHYARAGWWIAAAILVKATAGLALVPLLAWAWMHGRWRAAGRIAAAPLLVAIPVMLLTPGMTSSLDSAKTNVITRASIWNIPLRLWPSQFPHAAHLVSLSLALVVVLVAGTAWVARRDRDPAPGVVGATAAWLVFSAYVLPWYSVWALPTAALRTRTRLAWLVGVQGAAIVAVSVIPRSSLTGRGLVSDLVHLVLPVALAALFVWAVVPWFRSEPESEPDPVAAAAG